MEFSCEPLKYETTEAATLRPIASDPGTLMSRIGIHALTIFERAILRVPPSLRVIEYTYRSPVESRFPENNTGKVRYYPVSKERAVIVLPQRGGGVHIARMLAAYLAVNGISAYEMVTPLRDERLPPPAHDISDVPLTLEDLKTVFCQAVSEVRGLAAIAEEESIGILGISLGGVYASVAYGIEERLKSACLVVSGGRLAEMVFSSEDRFARHLRDCIATPGMTVDELAQQLQDIEPCSYTRPDKKVGLFMINARLDRDVPEQFGTYLWEAWGGPRQEVLSAGHVDVARYALRLLPMIVDHYKESLKDG